MYKFLLCWRYLRTRYIALVTIVSVMLGVATMIVVNAVMEGFTNEMQQRIHGILSDLVFTSRLADGIPDADRRMAEIRQVAGDYIEGMSPTVAVPALLSYSIGNQYNAKQVMVIGIDEATYASVSDFGQFLQHPANRQQLAFALREGGYDAYDHQASDPAKASPRPQLPGAGWTYRKNKAMRARPVVAPATSQMQDPFQRTPADDEIFDPGRNTHAGAVLGIGLCAYRALNGSDEFLALPGDDVEISYPSAGMPPQVRSAKFTIVDFYESKMSEYDSSFVFVPLGELQKLRGMIDDQTGIANFTSIQIRVKDGVDLEMVRDLLRKNFPPHIFDVETWRDKQGALLAAVQMETAVLNVLLFMIIAVAGFGILAIFFMIVVEKTRDIGILKSLGASAGGVMSIFLSYGLSLGIVGAGVGLGIGLLFVKYINEIADLLGRITGRPVFDPSIYYFQKIPTIIHWPTVTWIVAGAIVIAVVASILPARRAARLHPVEALRYE
jgi:lipoprotein-releasing system permease protein